MLDDGQPESRTLCFPRPAFIHPIEALGKTRYMFLLDADATIPDQELRAFGSLPPHDVNPSTLRRIPYCIGNQVAEGAAQFLQAALHIGAVHCQRNRMLASRQRLAFPQYL